ncbi:MAG: hypothetical protein AB7K52_06770 [Phycisphaerales bacterium]
MGTPHTGILSLCVLAATLAVASPQADADPPAGAPPALPREIEIMPPTGELDFAAEPLRIESVGLTMRLPVGSSVTTTQTGSLVRATIRDGKRNWIINVETPRTENPRVTVEDAARQTLMTRLKIDEIKDRASGEQIGSLGLVMDQVHNLRVPGCPVPGERFYLSLPQGTTDRMVQGYTLFKISAHQFIAFELICAEGLFPTARRAYESAIATLQVEDPATLDARRRAAITAGISFFEGLTPAAYDQAVETPAQLYRLYVPASSGSPADAEERGYRVLRFFKGTRAEIDPKASDTRPGSTNPSGYLAELKARLLDKLPTGDFGVTDVEATYFVSTDRREEAWTVRMVHQPQAKAAPVVFSETGTRSGTSMTVIVNRPGLTDPTLRPMVPPEGYMSQAEAFLLPRLMIGAGAEVDIGTYAYNWSTQNVTLRRDSIAQDPAMPGVWKVSTIVREGVAPMTYLFRKDGELISAVLNDGIHMEPAWPDELERLWKSKDLPTERMSFPKATRRR